jgi:hypothetical protein
MTQKEEHYNRIANTYKKNYNKLIAFSNKKNNNDIIKSETIISETFEKLLKTVNTKIWDENDGINISYIYAMISNRNCTVNENEAKRQFISFDLILNDEIINNEYDYSVDNKLNNLKLLLLKAKTEKINKCIDLFIYINIYDYKLKDVLKKYNVKPATYYLNAAKIKKWLNDEFEKLNQ